jgi:hypothetical protein
MPDRERQRHARGRPPHGLRLIIHSPKSFRRHGGIENTRVRTRKCGPTPRLVASPQRCAAGVVPPPSRHPCFRPPRAVGLGGSGCVKRALPPGWVHHESQASIFFRSVHPAKLKYCVKGRGAERRAARRGSYPVRCSFVARHEQHRRQTDQRGEVLGERLGGIDAGVIARPSPASIRAGCPTRATLTLNSLPLTCGHCDALARPLRALLSVPDRLRYPLVR